MRRVVIDAYNFVGLRGGSGGSGSYVLSLIEHLARLVDVRVIASEGNRRLFSALTDRARRLTVHVGDGGHAAAIRAATDEADILYAPFTSLPERASYDHLPVVTAIHDLQHRVLTSFFPEPERVERDNAYFAAAADADAVLTFSQAERGNIQRTYNVASPIGVVPHAPFLAEEIERSGHMDLSIDRNPYRAKYGRYVLYPAVNWPHKNHYRLLEAFRFLCQAYGVGDVKLVLTGASCVEPREHFYRALLDEPWAKDSVVELGFVSSLQLFLLTKGAEVLAFPSMYEGFGIPVVESLRLGTPVIASNLPVMQEWFGGYFQPFADIRNSLMMADDLYNLLGQPARRAALSKTGYEHSLKFSSKRMAQETLDFLSGVADEFYSSRQQRSRPHRDMVQLRRKNHRLLFHVIIDKLNLEIVEQVRLATEALRLQLDYASVGFVFLVPTDGIGTARPELEEPKPDSGTTKRRGKAKRGAAADAVVAVAVSPTGSAVQVGNELVAQLATCATDIVYYDDQDDGLARVIRFYTSTQVDASFHYFVPAKYLADLAADDDLVSRCLQVAFTQPSDSIDCFYMGPLPWAVVHEQVIQAVHEAPWSIDDPSQDSLIPGPLDFVLTDRFVREHGGDYFGSSHALGLALQARVSQPQAKFAYIETELKQRVGHHFALVSGLCEVAKAGGLVPIVGANIDALFDGMSDGIQVDPYFSSYSQAPEEYVTPTHFAEELLTFMDRHKIGASDYVYLHMPYPTLMTGVLQIVATSRLEDLPVFLIRVCSVDESFRWHDIRETSCIRAITELGGDRRQRIRIFVESVPLQRYFEEATGERLPVLLNPVVRELVVARLTADRLAQQRGKDSPLYFGFFGEARQEKGFQLLPGIVEGLLRRFGPTRVKFLLQVSASPQNDTDIIKAARHQLERLAEVHKASGAVSLFGNFQDMASYYAAIAKCNAMLMPYDPKAYRIRGSGVALEGLALGAPIIVARDTDMAVTFEGPGCVVATTYSAEGFEEACATVIEHYDAISGQLHEYVRTSPLIQSEAEYLRSLLEYVPHLPADVPAERPVALWIGNDVLSQGCSAVYQAQRGFLRRHGFEIYNIYVPFPDLGGHLHSDQALEKYLFGNSLGWRRGGYDFGCYSWNLNQTPTTERYGVLQEVADDGGSTERFLRLNSYNECPPSLLRLVENRSVDLVCLNYVHLLPIVEKLGLLGRQGTRLVLESHDIQAAQYAVRANREVDEEDKEFEISKLSVADAVVAISQGEYEEIRERNPWANVHFVLPVIEHTAMEWSPGASHLTSDWLDIWFQREDVREVFDLRTPASLMGFGNWVLANGRLEHPNTPIAIGMNAVAIAPHRAFEVGAAGTAVSTTLGSAWHARADLRAKWPDARDPNHPDRAGLLHWAADRGMKELGIMADGGLSSRRLTQPSIPSALLEAFVLARPANWSEDFFRSRLLQWLAKSGRIDVIIVGSDHPANLTSIRSFIEGVFKEYLEPEGVSLLVVGRAGPALQLQDAGGSLFALGEVENLDSLYEIASVVAVPTVTGSGTPIKVLDALARGLCVNVSEFVDRALGLSAIGFPMTNDPSDCAKDILELLKSPEARKKRIALAKQFAAANLTTEVYDAKWEQLADLPVSEHLSGQSASTHVTDEPVPSGDDSATPQPITGGRNVAKEKVDAD